MDQSNITKFKSRDQIVCLFIFKKIIKFRGGGYVKQSINLGRPKHNLLNFRDQNLEIIDL
jgi:hypothetical protein